MKPPKALVDDVREALLFISPYDPDPLKDSHSLRWDLGMAEYQRKALQVPFNRIAQRYNADAYIAVGACADLKTVAAAISLVTEAAGFENE